MTGEEELEEGINIPKRCADCKFCLGQKTNDYGSFGECLLQKSKKVNCLVWTRDNKCPMIPATDLVEKEKILDFIEDNRPTDIQTDWERGAAYICDEIEKIVRKG